LIEQIKRKIENNQHPHQISVTTQYKFGHSPVTKSHPTVQTPNTQRRWSEIEKSCKHLILSANPKTANPKSEWKKDEENIKADS
jgi:hypothetical protein